MAYLFWFLFVALAIITQWDIIENKHRYPDKSLWFILRVVIAAFFMWWFVAIGYYWYWTIIFMAGSFWWPFNTGLNLMRGKPIAHLSPENSLVDKLLVKTIGYQITFWLSLLFFIFAVSNMLLQGRCSWYELNHGLCL
jgi:hypothetical protein